MNSTLQALFGDQALQLLSDWHVDGDGAWPASGHGGFAGAPGLALAITLSRVRGDGAIEVTLEHADPEGAFSQLAAATAPAEDGVVYVLTGAPKDRVRVAWTITGELELELSVSARIVGSGGGPITGPSWIRPPEGLDWPSNPAPFRLVLPADFPPAEDGFTVFAITNRGGDDEFDFGMFEITADGRILLGAVDSSYWLVLQPTWSKLESRLLLRPTENGPALDIAQKAGGDAAQDIVRVRDVNGQLVLKLTGDGNLHLRAGASVVSDLP
jgi:hypothetical protein